MTKRTRGPDPFNNPFSKVRLPAPPDPLRREEKKEKKQATPDAEVMLFLEAMGEVVPTKTDLKHPSSPGKRFDPTKCAQEESESIAQLAELVSSDGPFEQSDDGELTEAKVAGFDLQVMKRLRRGGFRPEDSLDLHRLTREQAQAALEPFIAKARRNGHRCVLVITGKGLHGAEQIPVLRTSVRQWLSRGRLARHLLAFCSAQPADGGAGALYVLLRR